MDSSKFQAVIDAQIDRSAGVLSAKSDEYATADRLHNFKVAASLRGVSTRNALAGMMAKHTVSIYDMCMSDEDFTQEMWNEKITDHINYLLLLSAVVADEKDNPGSQELHAL